MKQAEKVSREGARRKLRNVKLRMEPDASYLSDSYDREVQTVVKAAQRAVSQLNQAGKWHSRTASEFQLVGRRTDVATDSTPVSRFIPGKQTSPKLLSMGLTEHSAVERSKWNQR